MFVVGSLVGLIEDGCADTVGATEGPNEGFFVGLKVNVGAVVGRDGSVVGFEPILLSTKYIIHNK